jgi:chromosome segregation ATPase
MRRIAIAVAITAITACATSKAARETGQVSDEDFARLPPGQMGPVDQARAQLRKSQDDLARVKLQAQQVSHEDDLAKAEQTAADAKIQQAQAQLKMAQDRGDQKAIAQANRAVETAKLQRQAADAHLDYVNKLASARQAQVEAAQGRVGLMQARVEQAKLQALQQAGIPAASKYDPAVFRRNVADAEVAYSQAQGKARDQMAQAQASLQQWHKLRGEYQAMAAGIQRG